MNKIIYNFFNEEHPLELSLNIYPNGNLKLSTTTWIEGFPEPFNFLTVNIDRRPLNCALVDTNNNGADIVEWLIANKLGEPTGEYGYGGFFEYPEIRFYESALRDINNETYNAYLAEFNKRSCISIFK